MYIPSNDKFHRTCQASSGRACEAFGLAYVAPPPRLHALEPSPSQPPCIRVRVFIFFSFIFEYALSRRRCGVTSRAGCCWALRRRSARKSFRSRRWLDWNPAGLTRPYASLSQRWVCSWCVCVRRWCVLSGSVFLVEQWSLRCKCVKTRGRRGMCVWFFWGLEVDCSAGVRRRTDTRDVPIGGGWIEHEVPGLLPGNTALRPRPRPLPSADHCAILRWPSCDAGLSTIHLIQCSSCCPTQRLLKCPSIKAKFRFRGRVASGRRETEYTNELSRHTLTHFLVLVLFLDRAKVKAEAFIFRRGGGKEGTYIITLNICIRQEYVFCMHFFVYRRFCRGW